MSIAVSNLSLRYPNGYEPFAGVSFRIKTADHAALVGENGAGKSTLLRVLAGELPAGEGDVRLSGDALYLSQSIGFAAGETIRELLTETAPMSLRPAGRRLIAAERAFGRTDGADGMELAAALAEWAELGGYELESAWDESLSRILGSSFADSAERDLVALSGGERKRLALDVLFSSSADILLLDEPDNYLDIPAKLWLEDALASSSKTILFVSHDRDFLNRAATSVLTLEGSGTWKHGGTYATYPSARDERQSLLGDRVTRWHEEERRLFHHLKLMKQRAAANAKNASRARAAETAWNRFRESGPPPPPARPRRMNVRLRGADGAHRALTLTGLGLSPLITPFSDIVFHGERIGLVGPNGTGKSHLLRILNGELSQGTGKALFGTRISVGMFSQVNNRPDFLGRKILSIVERGTGNHEKAMQLLARYGLDRQSDSVFDTLSGGQKARLEILALEQEGHNFLLLDEPTDNLDVDSSDSLETALAEFDGTCISVSHDREYLRAQDRYWMLQPNGAVFAFAGFEDVITSLVAGRPTGNARPMSVVA